MIVDMYDWKFVHVVSAETDKVYQAWDKGMDLYYWLFILWVVRSLQDKWARQVAWGLFVYRLSGMILFWVTNQRSFLLFFPNVFENFVIWYLFLLWLLKTKTVSLTSFQKTTMIVGLVIPKLIHEYFQHLLGRQPWELYDVGRWLHQTGVVQEYTNYLAWGGLLYVIPFIGFFLMVKYSKNT